MSEHDTQAAFFQLVGYTHPELAWLYAIPNGGLRNKATAGKLKAEGVKPGVWDVCLPLPRNGYHGLYIEFKHGKNKLTAAQVAFGEHLDGHGYKTGVAYSVEEAIEILEKYLEER